MAFSKKNTNTNFIIVKPGISREEFLNRLVVDFPAIHGEVMDDDYHKDRLIHLQVSPLARYTNDCIRAGDIKEIQRVFNFFEEMIEKVDHEVENALYLSFLEHIDMDGDSATETQARKILKPTYLESWKTLYKTSGEK